MTGSRKWFKYTADLGGAVYAINRDESITEKINGAVGDYADADTSPVASIPGNVKPRTLFYKSADGKTVRSGVALTAAIFANPPNPITSDEGVDLRLVRYRGEDVTAPLGFDTGLTDADAT